MVVFQQIVNVAIVKSQSAEEIKHRIHVESVESLSADCALQRLKQNLSALFVALWSSDEEQKQ